MDQDFDGLDCSKHSQIEFDAKNGAKNIRGLSRSVFSTSSMNKSLQKLSDLKRACSPQPKTLRPVQPSRLSNN
jgi:hypothetical protein